MQENNNKFILGLSISIAILSLIGFSIMAFANKPLPNNKFQQPEPIKKAASTQPAPSADALKLQVTENDHIRGNLDAKVTIIEFSDIQCPYCARYHATLKQILSTYPNDVRLVYKHFPLDRIHPFARPAAIAAECAGEQDKFWEYLDGLYENQRNINQAFLTTLAKTVGLNTEKFNSCISDDKYSSKINSDYQEGQNNGVTGTPGSFINGQFIKGAASFEQLQSIIENKK